jgi:predicted urease superfamily metal-dependent hydrolase
MKMKTINIDLETHKNLKNISKITGIKIYKLIEHYVNLITVENLQDLK